MENLVGSGIEELAHIERRNTIKLLAEREGYSIPEFCTLLVISTPTYYKMRAAGQGPREMRMVGSVVRISAEAFADWKRQREQAPDAATQKAALKARSRHAVSGCAVKLQAPARRSRASFGPSAAR